MYRTCFAAALALAAVILAQTAAPPEGKDLFERRCGGCHALDRDKEGPRLEGVSGRKAGALKSFEYSDALKNSQITWDAGSLDKWLAGPDSLVPNADMAFRLEKAEERQAIIAYLKQISR